MRKQSITWLIVSLLGTVLIYFASTFTASGQSQSPQLTNDIWTNLDVPVKVIAGVVALVVALLGLPVAFLQTRKTLVEIRKIELEAEELQRNISKSLGDREPNYRISFEHSEGNVVNIIADPRLLGPLLILLNFIIASVIFGLVSFGLGIFPLLNDLRNGILFVIACVLFGPLLVAATRSQKSLKKSKDDAEI